MSEGTTILAAGPAPRRKRPEISLEVILVAVLVGAACVALFGALLLSSEVPRGYLPLTQVAVANLGPTPSIPGVDTDHDGLLDIDENYVYGTNPNKVDTDGDGMPDWWEVQYKDSRNSETRELLVDPVNPGDAYTDPDADGYDYNNNGKIDTYQDSVVRSSLNEPVKAQYAPRSVCSVPGNEIALDGALVHFDHVAVMDNGTYGAADTDTNTAITLLVTDTVTARAGVGSAYEPNDGCPSLHIELDSNSNRPALLAAWTHSVNGGWAVEGDIVNIEGLFHFNRTDLRQSWLEVRGGEGFPNIAEYETWRNYGGTGILTGSNPLVRDTDHDGMWDGFEAHYGKGHLQVTNGTSVWVWDFFMSTVNASDAGMDPDGDGLQITWTELVKACLLRDSEGTCVHEVPAEQTPGDFTLAGTNLHEFYLHTRPDSADTDGDTFPSVDDGRPISSWDTSDMQEVLVHHTDPTKADTDGDGMPDGWEVFYHLLPLNASDKFEDPDGDLLPNINEYLNPLCSLNPRNNDTDSDGLPDGWEVKYQLDGCRNDANEDVDLTHGVVTPDGLTNYQEFIAGTNPRKVDTDDDNLTDFDEVTKTWQVTVEGVLQHFKTDPTRNDTDMDGLTDYQEVVVFHTNASNADTDLDGLSDPFELFTDRNATAPGLQITSPNLRDTDGDHLTDYEETPHVVNGSEICVEIYLPLYTDKVSRCTDPLNPDTDGDGLDDGVEVHTNFEPFHADGSKNTARPVSTDPLNPDTDGDGLNDKFEFDNSDLDGDGLPTGWEVQYEVLYPFAAFESDADGNGIPDILDDWDADGLNTLQEYQRRTDPFVADTDHNGILDSNEALPQTFIGRLPVYADSDGDGMPDWWEVLHGFDPNHRDDGCAQDADSDGFANLDEYLYNTDPRGQVDPQIPDKYNHPFIAKPQSCDSDHDGIANWWESYYGLNPDDPTDADRNLDKELNATGALNGYGFPVLADNWTNFEEYIFAAEPYNHISTDPTTGDSDLDAYNFKIRPDGTLGLVGLKVDWNKFYTDDRDPDPVVLWHTKRPVNPSVNASALSPIRPGDATGDIDRDGVNNTVEAQKGTSAFDPDTDGDGMPDGWEIQYAVGNTTTGKPILDPLYPGDANEDPDNDGWNYSRVTDKSTSDADYPNGHPIITRQDFNRDGTIDNFMDTEQFTNLKEYFFGDDTNGDGINDLTTHPGKRITNADQRGVGPIDGYVQYFRDRDFDQLPRWYEVMFHFDDANRDGVNGANGDPDADGVKNVIEARSTPWTSPRDPAAVPPQCSWPREFLPDPNNPPADWPC